MSLQDKIKKIINVISETNINEIEVTSFWGAQKIRLSKKVSSQNKESIIKDNITEVVIDEPVPQSSNSQENNSNPIHNEVVKETADLNENEAENISQEEYNEEDLTFQKAPLVGTFYISSKPGEPPFIKEGDEIVKGQILCIIEAMKIFNEIESDFEGTIVEILVDDQNPVEFNQPIFSIKEK